MHSGMKLPIAALSAFLLSGACMISVVPPAEIISPPTAIDAPAASLDAPFAAWEARAHGMVNDYRVAQGLPPLGYDPRIADLAREHSQQMSTGRRDFGHDQFSERFEALQQIVRLRSAAENVAYDSRNPPVASMVHGLIRSPGHRRNIEGSFDVTGVGITQSSDGIFYLSQLFVATR